MFTSQRGTTMRYAAIVLLIFCAGAATAQSFLQQIYPRPRAGYIRPLSAVFQPGGSAEILLDANHPAHDQAARINAYLRTEGIDTMRVSFASAADSLKSCIALGVNSATMNAFLAGIPDQRVAATETYPGPEGYVLDALPMRIVVNASDEAGLRYGVHTLLQLMSLDDTWHAVRACRIVDAPQFPNRWIYESTNLQVPGNITAAKQLWDRAIQDRCNGIVLADSKFSRISTVIERYYDSLRSLRSYAEERGLRVIPCVMPIGYSNSVLYFDPNLASGLPVRDQRFVVENDTARLLPRTPVSLTNGGFETHNGNTFPGYLFIDGAGTVSFADNSVYHSGSTAIRFENFVQPNGHGRISYWTRVQPFTQYHVGGWVRTEDLQPSGSINVTVLAPGSRTLTFEDFSVPSTSGWTRLDLTFNSLDTDTLGVYWGVWGARSGRIWWDDLVIEETSFVNLLRRDGAPLSINREGGAALNEGSDFDSLRDPLLGNISWPGDYDSWHTPPTLRLNAPIRSGDTITASYYHTMLIHGSQVAATMSDPKLYDILDREFAFLDSLWQSDTYFMQHDELRVCNWDKGDLDRGLTPAELLADNVQRCRDIIQRHAPGSDIWVWTDMFDEYHNAVAGPYYLVNGDLRGSADLLPKDVGMVNWNGREGIVQNSLAFFEQRGFRQMSAPYYDQDESQIRRWKEWTRNTGNFNGMMYTTWQQKYDHLEYFGEYAWNHAPYVEHLPPPELLTGQTMKFEIEVYGDPWDSMWEMPKAEFHYRTSPGAPFDTRIFSVETPTIAVHFDFPADVTWIQWYITVEDNRGWTTRVPYGDTVYYELGKITTEAADPVPAGLRILGSYPNPARSFVRFEWSSSEGIPTTIRILDLLGRTVRQQSYSGEIRRLHAANFDISGLSAGMYRVFMLSGREIQTAAVLIQR